jgi:hypothetical protein
MLLEKNQSKAQLLAHQKRLISKFFLSLTPQQLSQNRTSKNPIIFASTAHVRPIVERKSLYGKEQKFI